MSKLQDGLKRYQKEISQGLRERPKHKTPIEQAKENPNSLKKAIAAKCWDCVCADHTHGAKHMIGTCNIVDCPLWLHRPYQNIKSVVEARK